MIKSLILLGAGLAAAIVLTGCKSDDESFLANRYERDNPNAMPRIVKHLECSAVRNAVRSCAVDFFLDLPSQYFSINLAKDDYPDATLEVEHCYRPGEPSWRMCVFDGTREELFISTSIDTKKVPSDRALSWIDAVQRPVAAQGIKQAGPRLQEAIAQKSIEQSYQYQ